MICKNRNDLELALDLQRAGIPLHEDVLERMRIESQGLRVYQTGTLVENEIFDLGSGMGVTIALAIDNNARKNIRIAQFRLELPWVEPGFHWLEDPLRKKPRERLYKFPRPSVLTFERELVLNHRIGRLGVLLPSDYLDGLLLGVGEASIPESFQHRQPLNLQLRILDTRGRI